MPVLVYLDLNLLSNLYNIAQTPDELTGIVGWPAAQRFANGKIRQGLPVVN
jgi:hypothetical protein